MTKETKAQSQARQVQEQLAAMQEQEATYLTRLMSIMRRAQMVNFQLHVVDMTFCLADRNERDRDVKVLELQYSADADEALRDLEWDVARKEEAEREASRRDQVRRTALAKLTTEERELLDL